MSSTRRGAGRSTRRTATESSADPGADPEPAHVGRPARDLPSTRRAGSRSAGATRSAATRSAAAPTNVTGTTSVEAAATPLVDNAASIDDRDARDVRDPSFTPVPAEGAPVNVAEDGEKDADGRPMYGKGSGHQIGRRVHSELFCPPPPVRAGPSKPLPGSAMVSTDVPTLGVSRSGRERRKNSKLQDDNWGISDKELWAKKEVEAIKAQRQRFATEEDTEDAEFYVVRTEDVDPGGRHLVGIESGPYPDLYAAVTQLDKTPAYGPTSMSNELILLSNDARAYQDHSVSSRSGDGCHRFVIKGADRKKAVALHGAWIISDVAVDAVKHAEQYGLECFDLQRSIGAVTDLSASNPPFFGSLTKPKSEPKRKGKDRKGGSVVTMDSYPPGWFPLDAVKVHEPAAKVGQENAGETGQENAAGAPTNIHPGSEKEGAGGPIRTRDDREKEDLLPGPYTPPPVRSTSAEPPGPDQTNPLNQETNSPDQTNLPNQTNQTNFNAVTMAVPSDALKELERQAAVAAAEAARMEWELRERERLAREEYERWHAPPPPPVDPMPAPPPRMPRPLVPGPLIPIPAEISDLVRTKVLECFDSRDDAGRVAELHQMGQKVLQDLFRLAFDKTTKSNNNMWLRRKIAGAMGIKVVDPGNYLATQEEPVATRRSSRQFVDAPDAVNAIDAVNAPDAVNAIDAVDAPETAGHPETAEVPAADEPMPQAEPEPDVVNEPAPANVEARTEIEPTPEPVPEHVEEVVQEEEAPDPPAEKEEDEENEAVDSKAAEEFAKDGVPFVPGKYYGGSIHIPHDDVSNARASLEEYHSLRGQVMGGEEASKKKPSLPPPPRGRTQFQLATIEADYHVLAIRCGEGGVDSFSVRLNDRGYVYVGAKRRRKSKKSPTPDADGQEQTSERAAEPEEEKPDTASQSSEEESLGEFEVIMRFPTLIEESSAQSVFKDGVLFVVANPRMAHVVSTLLA